MHIAEDGIQFPHPAAGQDWLVAWYPPPDPPPGIPHGSEAICVSAGQLVLVGADGERWELPGGRPEAGETTLDTLRREVLEEACATVIASRLLGFGQSTCVHGPERGRVLVRSVWLAEVEVHPWQPRFEMTHRILVPAAEAFARLTIPPGLLPHHHRAFTEAGLPH